MRSLTFTFAPFRQTGVEIFNSAADDRLTLAVSGYRFQSDNFGNVIGSAGYGMAARITGLPLYGDEHHLLHLGLDYSYSSPAAHVLTYATFPEVFGGALNTGVNPSAALNNPKFVDTGAIPLNNVNLINVELAGVFGSFAVQSEVRWDMLNQRPFLRGNKTTNPGDVALAAAYVEGRWVMTGEDINYNKKNAVITRVEPVRPVTFHGDGGIGAWELVGRWSYIDINGTAGNGPGGQLNDLTLGLNWYMNKFTKLQFNYIHPFLNQPRTGQSNADFYAMRFQFDF